MGRDCGPGVRGTEPTRQAPLEGSFAPWPLRPSPMTSLGSAHGRFQRATPCALIYAQRKKTGAAERLEGRAGGVAGGRTRLASAPADSVSIDPNLAHFLRRATAALVAIYGLFSVRLRAISQQPARAMEESLQHAATSTA
jgi:hypothetical protein